MIEIFCFYFKAQHIRPDGNVYGYGGYGGYGPVGHGYGAYGYPAWNHWVSNAFKDLH